MKGRCMLLVLALLAATQVFSNVYYVSLSGDNSSGMTPAKAFTDLQKAADKVAPGDTVYVMNGTYTNSLWASFVVQISAKGTPDKWITFRNYPGHQPVIRLTANWAGISMTGASYIIIDGFTVIGNNDNVTLAEAQKQRYNPDDPLTSAAGISAQNSFGSPVQHSSHIIIRNCNVSKCGGAGIGASHSDYITIENNTVSECAWYSPYDGSAISLYQLWNSDNSTATKNYILRNTCYKNRNYIPFYIVDSITDGNGIIVDDSRNTQNGSTLGAYPGTTYIANNLLFNNGGHGINLFKSDNVTIVNNVSYQNCQSPEIPGSDLSCIYSGNIKYFNNISSPRPGLPPLGAYVSTNIVADRNIWATNSGIANPYGTNTKTGDPLFVKPSLDPSVADFHLKPGSMAIDAGTIVNAPTVDRDNNKRIPLDSNDIGAYQTRIVVPIPPDTAKKDTPIVKPPIDTTVVKPPVTPPVVTPPVIPPAPVDSTPVIKPPVDTPVVLLPVIPPVVTPPVIPPAPVDSTPIVKPPVDTTVIQPPVITPLPADSVPIIPVLPTDSLPEVSPALEGWLTNWTLSASGNTNLLNWSYHANPTLTRFLLQRSMDGIHFGGIKWVAKNEDHSPEYDFKDSLPANGTNYYRLAIFSSNAEIAFSSILSIDHGSPFVVTAYPIPANDHITVLISTKPGEKNLIRIFDALGKPFYSNTVYQASTNIDLSRWPRGFYVIVVGTTEKHSIKILVQ